jgi:hypothetical protein
MLKLILASAILITSISAQAQFGGLMDKLKKEAEKINPIDLQKPKPSQITDNQPVKPQQATDNQAVKNEQSNDAQKTELSTVCTSQIPQQIIVNRILPKYDKSVALSCSDPRLLQEIGHTIDLQLFRSSANDELAAVGSLYGVSLPKSVNSPVVPINWAYIKVESPSQTSTKK